MGAGRLTGSTRYQTAKRLRQKQTHGRSEEEEEHKRAASRKRGTARVTLEAQRQVASLRRRAGWLGLGMALIGKKFVRSLDSFAGKSSHEVDGGGCDSMDNGSRLSRMAPSGVVPPAGQVWNHTTLDRGFGG
jgi:hypothetical protein